jgi:hypothetical protein
MTDTESQRWSYVEASFPPDRMVSAPGNGVKEGHAFLAKPGLLTLYGGRERARHSRCGNQRLESRVRENRTHGSEGGEAKAFPTPILAETDVRTSTRSPDVTRSALERRYSAPSPGMTNMVDDNTKTSLWNTLS